MSYKWKSNPDVLKEMFVIARLAHGKTFELGEKLSLSGAGGIDKRVMDIARLSKTSFGDAVRDGEITRGAIGTQLRFTVTDTKTADTRIMRASAPRMAAVAAKFISFETASKLQDLNFGK